MLAALLLASAAMAAEQPSDSIMDSGSIYNALWAVGIFLVLLAILGRYAWKPILRALEERERMIAETIRKAQEQQAQSEKLLAEYQAKLDAADAEAQARLDEARRLAAEAREKILAAARVEAEELARRAAAEIGAAKEQAIEELYAFGAELATRAAEKILRKELQPADQERLVAESLQEIRLRARGEA